MAEDATPLGEKDTTNEFKSAAPLKDTGSEGGTLGTKTVEAKQAIIDGASKYGQQASDKARLFAEDGKAKAGSALDQIAQLLTDAAAQVDEKLGSQYGEYARTAANSVSTLSEQVKNRDIDQLVGDARALVQKSPAVAIGAAAAIGFVVARLVQSGLDPEAKG